MKVTETLGSLSTVAEVHGKDEKRASGSVEGNFQSRLKHIESRNYEEHIRELANRIAEQGKKLGKNVDIRELKIYKKMISEFLGEAVGSSHKFSKQNFLDRRGRHRVYAIIKKINGELDALTQEVLSDQKDNIRILQRIDDIRGLIMDIIM